MTVPVDLQSLHFTSLRHIAKLHIFALGLWTIASLSLTEKVLLANCLHLLRAFVTYIRWRGRFFLGSRLCTFRLLEFSILTWFPPIQCCIFAPMSPHVAGCGAAAAEPTMKRPAAAEPLAAPLAKEIAL